MKLNEQQSRIANCKEYDVSSELLEKYVLVEKMMLHGSKLSLTFFTDMEKERERLHNEILKEVGVDRSDKDFSYWLALITESMLNLVCK